MTTPTTWPGDWLRGVLEMAVLRVLVDEPQSYGYAMSLALDAAGLGTIKGGTLYPLLARLEESGQVRSRWEVGDGGPGRKYYEITPAGRAQLAERTAAWCSFADATASFLRNGRSGIPAPLTTRTEGAPAPALTSSDPA